MNEAVSLKSGHTLELKSADFRAAKALMQVVARELRSVEINLEGMDLKTLLGSDINSIKNVFLQVIQSEAVEKAVFDCAIRSLLNGQKITPASFEPDDMRPDYLPVAWEVMKAALTPFFVGIELPSSTPAEPSTAGQK